MIQSNRTFFSGLLIAATSFLLIIACKGPEKTQTTSGLIDQVITVKEVERIENVLAGDEMRGRKVGTPDIDRAADFLAAEMKNAGLEPVRGNSFLQKFTLIAAKQINAEAVINGVKADMQNIMVLTTQPRISVDENAGYEIKHIAAKENLSAKARGFMASGKNTVVFVDTSFTRTFFRLRSLRNQLSPMHNSVVFILGNEAKNFKVQAEHTFTEAKYTNVVGMLPGRSLKHEYVIFSGHYDHLGVGKPVGNDSIYNGANDDAAGVTGMIMLAKYFKALGNNERTIVFAAFTAEEVGGFGSQYFSRQYDADKVMAMFNIEMIGTESKWGKNSAFITGFEKTDMGAILQKNLEGTGFTFHPDPYPTQQLFYRSDNATLARLGVPAHTISTSKMDSEPNYHKMSDEVKTLDLENMTMIIKAIALSSKGIIAGKDTPTRVKVEELR